MATINLSTMYRPVRIGFLVRNGSIDDVVKAAGINTLLWGGIFNPVIPVSENKTFAESLMDLFSVDVLYPVTHTKDIDDLLAKHSFLEAPDLYARNIFYEDWRTKKNVIGYLDTVNIVDSYWDKEFKHKPKSYKSNCALVRWDGTDDLKNLFAISFGYFPSDYNLRDDFENAFLKGLRAEEINIQPKDSVPNKIGETIYPLLLTRLDLMTYGGTLEEDGIYIGDETNFCDLICFWNLRATGVDLQFLPKNHISRFNELIKTHLSKLDKKPDRPPNIESYITFYHRIANGNELNKIIKQFTTMKQRSISYCNDVIWNGLNIRPPTFYFQRDISLASVEKAYGHYKVAVNLPDKKFITDFRPDAERQNLVALIKPLGEFEYPEYTLKPPLIRKLNEFYSREITFNPWSLRAEREGIGVIIEASDKTLLLCPLSYQTLIQKLFELSGIKTEVSQSGLIAKRIIEKLAGIEGGRVFKIRGVRKLLQGLKTDDDVTRGEATKRIWENGEFEKYESLYIEARKSSKLDTNNVFDFLLKKDFFRAGLGLICAHCKLPNWLSLEELNDIWSCNYCGDSNKTSLHLKDRGDWKFRKSGLFSKDNNQEGAIPVILSLLAFLRVFGLSPLVYYPALKLEFDSEECEIDFCVLQYERGEKIELGIGECKSEGGKINTKDIENMNLVRKKFDSIGINCYLVFSKTTEKFEPEEIDLFKDLRKDNIPFVLLTNRELEPYHPYSESVAGLPYRYAATLQEMDINSKYSYL